MKNTKRFFVYTLGLLMVLVLVGQACTKQTETQPTGGETTEGETGTGTEGAEGAQQ